MEIPLIDLKAEYREIKKGINNAIKRVISQGNFILGEEVESFEREFARYCGTKYAVGVNSGTDALFLSLLSLDIGNGDEVIVPALTYVATAFAVSFTGAKPVFVDIDETSYNIDAKKIEKAITKKTKAIIPVHLYGQVADMQPIIEIAKKHNLKVIEDACQAHGAEYKGRKAGSLGDLGCFSFYPTKNLGCYGDGGAITTNSKKIYEKLLMLRNYGQKTKYIHIAKGYNSRLDVLQAAILKEKLKKLDSWNELRRKKARIYNALLKNVSGITLPEEMRNAKHIYYVYAVRIKNRDKVCNELRKNGICTVIHYPLPLHLQKAYKELNYKKEDFPIAEKVAQKIISLPMYPQIKERQIRIVAKKLISVMDK